MFWHNLYSLLTLQQDKQAYGSNSLENDFDLYIVALYDIKKQK